MCAMSKLITHSILFFKKRAMSNIGYIIALHRLEIGLKIRHPLVPNRIWFLYGRKAQTYR